MTARSDSIEQTQVSEQPVTATDPALGQTPDSASAEDVSAEDDAEASLGDPSEDDADSDASEAQTPKPKRPKNWSKMLALGVLPALAMMLALTAGFLKWQESSARDANLARTESVTSARDATIAMLSYQPDTVDKQLGAARDLLTGPFRDSYASLTNDTVIPGARQKRIAAVASVPAAASVTASSEQAVALVFVDQTVTVGNSAPTDTASTVRVTMERVGNRWLISGFDPV